MKPTTRVPAEVRQELPEGRSITFVDLPGIGESKVADQNYLAMYKRELGSADILLWLFSAESRSLLTDVECIASLARDEHSRGLLSTKVSFALTKADLVAHPWLLSHDGEHASLTPHPDKHHLLTAKADYVREMLRLGDIGVAIPPLYFATASWTCCLPS